MENKQLEFLLYRLDMLERRVKELESRHNLDEYFTVQEVADSLRLNPITIIRKINDGEITAIKIGKEYRIQKEEVDKYILSIQVKK